MASLFFSFFFFSIWILSTSTLMCAAAGRHNIAFLQSSAPPAPPLSLTTPPSPGARPGPSSKSNNETAADQFLKAHNPARAAVGVGPLTWSIKLAVNASLVARFQRDKKACQFAELSGSSYGANQGWTSFPASPAEVVGSWVEEKKYYNHSSNTCAAGQQCGTYTQVVWRKSLLLGCAQVHCNANANAGATLTICLYDPHGNVQGQSPY